jgi:hypothetical protein
MQTQKLDSVAINKPRRQVLADIKEKKKLKMPSLQKQRTRQALNAARKKDPKRRGSSKARK